MRFRVSFLGREFVDVVFMRRGLGLCNKVRCTLASDSLLHSPPPFPSGFSFWVDLRIGMVDVNWGLFLVLRMGPLVPRVILACRMNQYIP